MAENYRIEELRRRVQMDPASIAFAALAEEYRRMGRHDEAVATCRAGLQRHPAYLSARVTLGRALLEMGRYDEARVELDHVLRAAPENLAAIRGLAELHRRRHEFSSANQEVDSSMDQSPAPEAAEPLPALPLPFTPAQTDDRAEAGQLRQDVMTQHPSLVALESFLSAIRRARSSADDRIPTASGQ
jgi:tetratricopeptide (TPR) repeat protein